MPRRPLRRSCHGKITLPESVALRLDKLARSAGEPPAKIAAHMVRQAIADAESSGPTQEPRAQDNSERSGDPNAVRENRRPPWLEPYGGSREWRGLMWAAIVGLHARYPDALSSLKDGWWQDATHLGGISETRGASVHAGIVAGDSSQYPEIGQSLPRGSKR